MEWIETTGRTVEEALESALDQLGIDERDAEVEVVEEPKTGLFGRLRTEARIRARVRPTRPRPKVEGRERSRRRPNRGSKDPAGRPPPPRAEKQPAASGKAREANPVTDKDVPLDEQAEVGRAFVEGLVRRLDLEDASVEVRHLDEETVEISVNGSELGLLIGPKGSTLNALQDVTRTVVHRKTGGRNGRILVDVANYRQKRKMALERFIKDVAAQVKAGGSPKALEPMGPADRKVVHDTVNAIEGVATTSEGEEPHRRVVIQPE